MTALVVLIKLVRLGRAEGCVVIAAEDTRFESSAGEES